MHRVNRESPIVSAVMNHVQHYNHEKYWKMRDYVISSGGGRLRRIKQLIYLYRIKRMDAFNNASMGTDIGFGAQFATPPHL